MQHCIRAIPYIHAYIVVINSYYYKCYNISWSILHSFYYVLVPAPLVILSAPEVQVVGQSLTLKCDITTVKGITSRVDVIWGSGDLELKRTEGINISSMSANSLLYTDFYLISQLSTAHEDTSYKCTVVITGPSPAMATDDVLLNVTGK